MSKNKIFDFTILALLVLTLFFAGVSFTNAKEQKLPDNVKITTSPDGSSTTVLVNSKPGFTMSVQTNCVNGKCTHSATSKEISKKDIKMMEDNFKKQQESFEKFWKIQEELFQQQQKIFQELWKTSWF